MKTSKVLMLAVVAFGLSLSMNNFASAKGAAGFSVAVVDVQKIVTSSPHISALKTEQKNKLTELGAFVEKAKADVASQKDAAKKKTLEESYNQELNSKKADLEKDYAKKLTAFDKSVRDIIKEKSADYDLVLTKNVVLKGGVDITSEVIKELK